MGAAEELSEYILEFYADGPVLDAYVKSREYMNAIIGPLGSGKTTGSVSGVFDAINEMPWDKTGVRRSRWCAIRNTENDLRSTTIKDWLDVVPIELGSWHGTAPITHTLNFEQPDGREVFSEVIFLPLDLERAIKKLRGYQLTGIWFNELKELMETIVMLGLARCGRYPKKSMMAGKRYFYGGFGDSNAPEDDHWLYKKFEEETPKNWACFKQPGGVLKNTVTGEWDLNPKAENIRNLDEDYYNQAKEGFRDDWIKVNLGNEYGVFSEGDPVHPEYNDDVHSPTDYEFDYDDRLAVYVGMDFGRCYDDKTEVLTDSGWKFFKEVSAENDLAATRNPETGEFEYTVINFKTDEQHDGDMIIMENKALNMCVTPEHRIPITHRDTPEKVVIKTAEWIEQHPGGHHFVNLTSKWTGTTPALIQGYSAKWFCYFIGVFLTDGSLEKGSNRVAIAQTKPKHVKELREFLGDDWTYSNGQFRKSDRHLAAYLRSLGELKPQRRIPREITSLCPELLSTFIEGMIFGDGSRRTRSEISRNEEVMLYTAHKHIADSVQEIVQKIGWTASICKQKGSVSKFADGREAVSSDGYRMWFRKKVQRSELQLTKIHRVHYTGRRYCLNVPYHTLYVRREGKPHWNGNTPAAALFQEVAGGYQMFDEFGMDNTSAVRFAPELKLYLAKTYGITKDVTGGGDPSGGDGRDNTEDTAIELVQANGFGVYEVDTNDTLVRRKALSDPLTKMRSDGKPQFLIHRRCKMTRKGLAGKFYFRRLQVKYDNKFTSEPEKNEYSHYVEALEYGLMARGEGLITHSTSKRRGRRESTGWQS